MSTRRSFLTSLGVGLTGLSMPAVAGAWGRRRRCASVTYLPAPVNSTEPLPPPGGVQAGSTKPQWLCPQSAAKINGVWYVNAEACPPQSPALYQTYSCQSPPSTFCSECNCSATCPEGCSQYCIPYSTGGQHILAHKVKHPIDEFAPPSALVTPSTLKQKLPMAGLTRIADHGGVGMPFIAATHDCQITANKKMIAVRLILLALPTSQSVNTGGGGFVLYPIGQEGDANLDKLPAADGTEDDDNNGRILVHNGDTGYHVLYLK